MLNVMFLAYVCCCLCLCMFHMVACVDTLYFGTPSPHVSLLGCLYPVPRVIMAMADDGLLSKSLARVNSCTKTPLNASFVTSSLAGEILTRVPQKEHFY